MTALTRLLYRVRQLAKVTRAHVTEEERACIGSLLTPAQEELFYALDGLSQRHALDVYLSLIARGHRDGELLRAALLHDVGKRDVRLLHRVLGVVLNALSPALLRWLAATQPGSWRWGLFVDLHHAEWGAGLVKATGASQDLVDLIRCHQRADGEDLRLRALQEADGAN